VVTVCAGAPAARRGFVVERLAEAEPRLRSLQAWAAAATVGAVVIGLPGVSAIGHGKGRVPALTFSHWIYFGASHQHLALQGSALAVAAAALLVGVVGAAVVPRRGLSRLWTRVGLPRLSSVTPAALGWVVALTVRAGGALAGEVVAVDHGLVDPLYDTAGEGMETAAWALDRVRARRFRLGLGVTLVVVLLLVGASVLAAGGHFPVHTT
jgi:hypothetical protein